MKKWIILAVIVALFAAGGYYLYTSYRASRTSTRSAVKTEALASGNLEATVSAIGTVRARQSASLYWGASGTVENVTVQVGDTVDAHQELARLAQSSLSQNIILAQAELFSSQKALDDLNTTADANRIKAMQDIASYEQNVRDAQLDLDNFTTPSNMVSLTAVEAVNDAKTRLDAARQAFEPYKYQSSGDATRQARKDTLDLAQADYNTAIKRLQYEYKLEVAQHNLDEARANYEKWKNGPQSGEVEAAKARIAAQQATLAQAAITSPFAAIITEIGPQVGDKVASNDLAFRLDDLSKMYVDVQVSEIDVNQVQAGQPVTLTLDAIAGRKYSGVVTRVAMVGVSNSNVVDYKVTVELHNPDQQVRPGMIAEVKIIVASRNNVLLVPNQALRKESKGQVVYVLQPDGSRKRVELTLGVSGDTYSEVLSGNLKAGQIVVLNPTDTTAQDQMMGPPGPFGVPRPRSNNDTNNRNNNGSNNQRQP